MNIKKISLSNFRNFEKLFLEFSSKINIIIGKNGQGKTNLLEAIYLLATGESHRTNRGQELIMWEREKFNIQLLLEKENTEIKLSYSREGSNKVLKMNNNPVDKVAEFIGNLNVVLFSPEDLKLVKGGPSYRRNFINTEVSQVSSYYHHLFLKYQKVLKQRNNLLKEIRENKSEADMLEIWDKQLIELGSKIIKKRQEVIKKIKILARLKQRRITGGKENLNIAYENSLNDNKKNIKIKEKDIPVIFKEKLVNNREKEINRGYTTIGPHRDDILLEVNGKDVRKFGSQGQQRTVALALKMAELEFMKSEIGEYPVLLLDDVFSELDQQRKKLLIDLIRDNIQTFITSTEDKYLTNLKAEANLYHVSQGKIFQERPGE